MTRLKTVEQWVDEISETADMELENFSANHAYERALEEIFQEVYDLAGVEAVDDLGELALEIIRNRRHPKSARLRTYARRIVVEEYDQEISMTSPLVKSRHG